MHDMGRSLGLGLGIGGRVGSTTYQTARRQEKRTDGWTKTRSLRSSERHVQRRHLQEYGASAASGLEAKNRTEEGEGRNRARV